MKAIVIENFGAPDQLAIREVPEPDIGEYEILVRVKATALNRADLLQRRGLYPPPAGESDILGLEMAGVVEKTGARVTKWNQGDRVCGLLLGGGYAQLARIHEDMAWPIPQGFSLEQAAAIPEVFLTAFQATRWLAQLKEGEIILIHAGASGVGTAAIQLARAMGARPMVTASEAKHSIVLDLGAEHAIDYKKEAFDEEIRMLTDNKGVNVIIDFIGGPYLEKNLKALAQDGRLVMLGFMGGPKVSEVNLAPILRKRLQLIGSTLRSRDLTYKIALAKDLHGFAWPLFEKRALKPIVDRVFDWTEVVAAHQFMEANKNKGKIILKVE